MASNGGVKNAAMKAGRGLAKARNQGASYAAGGMINANPAAATGMANAAPRAMLGRPGMKAGGMIPMTQAAVAGPKKAKRGSALPMKKPPFMKG